MSDKINVDTRKLHTDLVIIQDCLDQSTIDRRNIQNDYQDLIKEWKGPAADSFNTKFENSDSKVKSMYEDLQRKWTHCLMYAIRLRLVKKCNCSDWLGCLITEGKYVC